MLKGFGSKGWPFIGSEGSGFRAWLRMTFIATLRIPPEDGAITQRVFTASLPPAVGGPMAATEPSVPPQHLRLRGILREGPGGAGEGREGHVHSRQDEVQAQQDLHGLPQTAEVGGSARQPISAAVLWCTSPCL